MSSTFNIIPFDFSWGCFIGEFVTVLIYISFYNRDIWGKEIVQDSSPSYMNSENKETGKWFASPRSRTDVGCESKPETTCCSSGRLLANNNTVEEDEWGKLLTCLKEK